MVSERRARYFSINRDQFNFLLRRGQGDRVNGMKKKLTAIEVSK